MGPWELLLCLGAGALVVLGLLIYWMVVVFRGARRR